MGLLYGIELPDTEVQDIVYKWRAAHPNIKRYWYDLEGAIRQAFRNPGESFKAGLIIADRIGHTVRLKMPGGSYLCYPHFDEGEDGQCSYEGLNQYTRQWERIESYGPKFFENVVQKISRDILARGMINAEKAGHELVMHVHDELVSETDDDSPNDDMQLSKILATNPSWALGLPLAAAGYSTTIYRKE
jgi:DNA polymerase